ncbi:hypothetical protein CT362_004083 [Escherichia coli]|nr:hypothetical protein [Escherichia coli]EFI0099791.1 hypothetical protein [Escherichia coli]EFQ2024340.1 hypothetical protein [Escherichia coli]EHQ4291891.1 hypothetical protein [Escherichia coli]EHQ4301958.1 hypothetical protein [Escherichia coli]
MKKQVIVAITMLISTTSFAEPGKFEFKAADLMEQQKFTEWQHYASVKPFFSMNGRRFTMTLDDFADIIRNTFQQCNDLDAYTNHKGTRDSCQEYIYNGMKEWIKLSKDPSVSQQAWKIGARYAFNTNNPVPGSNVIDFNGWSGGIRVAKSKGF